MATVWCAQDRTLDRHVAIKLLAEPFAHDELAGRRFKREARAAARLSGHPNVVTIYDVGEAPSDAWPGGRPFLVMEYLAGGTAADALRTGRVDPITALAWLQEAAAALDYAHRRGVIHRDVKLANFLLDHSRVLHVADFGIAQLGSEDTLTVSGEVLGTAAYLAPERALGQPATEASDRYGLAVAAFELLVGQRPFTAEHFAAQARQHVEDPPPMASSRNPALPPAIDAVLTRGMAKRPEARFASCLEFTDALEAALVAAAPSPGMPATAVTRPVAARQASARPVAAQRARPVASGAGLDRPAPPPVWVRHRSSRHRLVVLAALAAALLGVGIAAAVSGGGGPSPRHTALANRSAGHRSTPRHPASTTAHHQATTQSPPPATTSAPPATTAPATAPPTGADALETQGHALMMAGNYQSAIPILRRAVTAAAPSSITYAYALYDLGRSLRLAGDPRAAVPILWRRLQIPNQTDVVRNELTLALRALGQQASAQAGPGPGKHHKDKNPGGQGD